MVLDISGRQLDAAFIDTNGAVRDECTITKSPPQIVGIDFQPWDATNTVRLAAENPVPVAVLGSSVVAGDAFIGTDTIVTADCEDLGCHP